MSAFGARGTGTNQPRTRPRLRDGQSTTAGDRDYLRVWSQCFTSAQKDTGEYGSIRSRLVKYFACKISAIGQNDWNVRFAPKADIRNAQAGPRANKPFASCGFSSGVSPSPGSQPRGSTVTNDRRVFAPFFIGAASRAQSRSE
jgi:hypothetical protein